MRPSASLPILACAALACAALGCSESEPLSFGRLDPDGAQGALNMEIYAAENQTCPVGNVHVELGNTKVVPPELIADGADEAEVTCVVKPVGDQFVAGGRIAQKELDLTFKNITTSGITTYGDLRVKDPNGEEFYESSATQRCVFTFAPGTGQGISAGQIFVQFDCADLVNEKDPSAHCSSRVGYLRMEKCGE